MYFGPWKTQYHFWTVLGCFASSALRTLVSLWPPYVADVDVLSYPCGFFFLLFPCLFSAVTDVSTIGKKIVKQQYLLQMSLQYCGLWPTNGWDRFTSLGHPSKFQWVSHLGFVTAPMSLNGGQPNFARCLAVSWAGTLYIHFWELLPPNGILPGAKFTLHPNLACSYIGIVTAWHSTTGC